jgi:nitroimidazol reductase NimA-like FMN-containing flavoprotein (pyridoxamine 5'-phosphate oxidase superfamily)
MSIQWMSEDDARQFLAARIEGRLATCNLAGEPYITPLNYFVRENKIYLHSKLTGRKLDNLAENPHVCFEVSETAKNVVSYDAPCACATRYTSVLVFGSARVLTDNAEKTVLLNRLVERFAGGKPFQPVEERHATGCAVIEIAIESISGKKNVDPEELAALPVE